MLAIGNHIGEINNYISIQNTVHVFKIVIFIHKNPDSTDILTVQGHNYIKKCFIFVPQR